MAVTNERSLTDEEVEEEIERLSNSPLVKLAIKEQRFRYKRRQRLYQLRSFERKGKQLAAEGMTLETLEEMISKEDLKEECD